MSSPSSLGPAPILAPVLSEHLEEAAFVGGQWERALGDPEYTLLEVATGPEARLAAHVDALVIAGKPAAESLLLPELEADDPALAFAAATVLLAAEDADWAAAVLGAVPEAEPEPAEGILRAIELSSRPDLYVRLAPWLGGAPALQAAALRVLRFQRLDPKARLDVPAGSKSPQVRREVLRLAALFPERLDPAAVDRALASSDEAERAAALETGLILGSKAAWAACEATVREGGPAWSRAALLWALSGEADLAPLLSALRDEERRTAALVALGFSGRAAAVDAVLPLLRDEQAARLAAEAVSLITGLAIAGEYAAEEPAWDPNAPEPEEPEEEAGGDPAEDLPAPNPEAIEAWWADAAKKFVPTARYLGGAPWTAQALVAALREAPMFRRPAHALDLAIRSRGACQLELRDLASVQWRALAALATAAERVPTVTYRDLIKYPAPARSPQAPRGAWATGRGR